MQEDRRYGFVGGLNVDRPMLHEIVEEAGRSRLRAHACPAIAAWLAGPAWAWRAWRGSLAGRHPYKVGMQTCCILGGGRGAARCLRPRLPPRPAPPDHSASAPEWRRCLLYLYFEKTRRDNGREREAAHEGYLCGWRGDDPLAAVASLLEARAELATPRPAREAGSGSRECVDSVYTDAAGPRRPQDPGSLASRTQASANCSAAPPPWPRPASRRTRISRLFMTRGKPPNRHSATVPRPSGASTPGVD